ncbi:MAG: RidA family protein [Verrucomicrobiales bacterium]|nr:RidA family protein [Verrucomicrobiales bacterium]MED5585167.1 RidA family protein [Verrucomicrobiota bacterium]
MEKITAKGAPEAIGPYSHAIRSGSLCFTSGQIPVDPSTGSLVEDDITSQTRQVLTNLRTVLEAAGLGLKDVVKTTVYLKDMSEFPILNAIYAEYFGEHAPARSTIQVAALPLDCRVEIEAVAQA